MNSKKAKSTRKDPMKTPKVWERARREKMKIYFNELEEVLPFYDPSTPMSRFEILQKSKICIKDLQDQNQDLLNGGFDEVYKNKMAKLKQRVKELLKRVDQLTDLLRAANIMIPPLEMYPEDAKNGSTFKWMSQRPKKWTEKINLVVPDEKIKSVLSLIKDFKKHSGKNGLKKKEKSIEKAVNDLNQNCAVENKDITSDKVIEVTKKKVKKVISERNDKSNSEYDNNASFNGSLSPSQFKENQPIDYNLISVNNTIVNKCNSTNQTNSSNTQSSNNEISEISVVQSNSVPAETNRNKSSEVTSTQVVALQTQANNKMGLAQQNIVLPTPTNVLQSNTYILTNDGNLVQIPILNSSSTVFEGNSNLLTPATIIKSNTGLLTPIVINKPSPVIVLQKPAPQIIQTAQILNAAPQVLSVSKSNVQIINSSIIYTSSSAVNGSRPLSHILSKAPANKKRIMRDTTITTYVNKIPIAALSKHSYTKKTMANTAVPDKNKTIEGKAKDPGKKQTEREVETTKVTQEPTLLENTTPESDGNSKAENVEKNNFANDEYVLENTGKRNAQEEKLNTNKKQKLKQNLEENFFKPIENPIETDAMFCNLALPNTINPSLSVSPTAAFLSSFPIVAPIRSETDEEVGDKKGDDGKVGKASEGHQQQADKMSISKNTTIYAQQTGHFYGSNQSSKLPENISVQYTNTEQSKINYQKNEFYAKDQRCKNLEKTTEAKCFPKPSQNSYMFDFAEPQAHPDKLAMSKTVPVYTQQTDNFFISNQISSSTIGQSTKMSSECSTQFNGNDQSKMPYSKNDFYGKDQHCKNAEKRSDSKCYPKTPQNSYNIFDYNYAGSCYTEDDTNKYCGNTMQPYTAKNKKSSVSGKKKVDGLVQDNQSIDPGKRPTDQILANLDFNSVSNQECYTWMPGKNVDWLPGKSFGLDGNLVVPSTLPTLVGDLALGTNSANDVGLLKPSNPKNCQPGMKGLPNDIVDLGMATNISLPKPMDAIDANKQYLEPFANLSKNIFDVTPSNIHNSQMGKNDFEKVNYLGGSINSGSNANETIILKNIFELPVAKNGSGTTDFSNRHKQRNITNHQNSFLSVSQLVEPPSFESSGMKNESGQLDAAAPTKSDPYGQMYTNFSGNPKNFNKNKSRSSHCKYNDRKYQGYKNMSSSYTAEALIRSNNATCQSTSNEFAVDINTNYFNVKSGQKPEQFPVGNKTDFEIGAKTDFQGPNQNLYTDFNFSSPVPNFTIGPTVGSTDFGTHDGNGNFATGQNNSYFADFIPPEYPLSENVSNSLLIPPPPPPPCSISLQSPFVIDKRNFSVDKIKINSKQCSATTKSKKHYDCSKSSFNEFSIPPSSAIFTTASLTCPPIFTTSACHNLLPVPNQSIPISFSSPSFTNSFPHLPPTTAITSSNGYHKFSNPSQNPTSDSFLPANAMFTTACTSKANSSSVSVAQTCYSSSSNPLTCGTNSVILSPFSVGNVPFSTSSQSAIPFFSLSNPIIPSSAPTSSSNSLANFNLSTIFPEINQKGNYHYS